MQIRLDCGNWYINGYVIEGSVSIGSYHVYLEDAPVDTSPLFSSKHFEECLTWCYNS